MARKFLTPIDLSKLELLNARIQNLGSAPTPVTAADKGLMYFNTSDNTLYWCDGTGWVAAKAAAGATPATAVTTSAVGDAATVGVSTNFARQDHLHGREAFGTVVGQTAFGSAANNGGAVTLARSDHTHGTPAHDAAAHSGIPLSALSAPFAAAVADTTFGSAKVDGVSNSAARADHIHGNPTHVAADHATIPISALATATAPINMGAYNINNVGTPGVASDAANKGYVDNLVAGLAWKDSVRLASTAEVVSITGLAAIDGVTPVTNDRILLKNQSAAVENGIWLAAAGAWTRATDADVGSEMVQATVFVEQGTTQADTAWTCTTNAPITLNVTGLTWVQFAGGGSVTAGAGMTQSGNVLNVIGDASATIEVTADQIRRGALTGDVQAVAGFTTTLISPDAVTNLKLGIMPAHTFKGNNTGSSSNPSDLTVAQMKTELGLPTTVVGKFAAAVAAATSSVINHLLNTRDVAVDVYRVASPYDTIECDVERTDVNNVTVRFATAPAAGEYRVVVMG